MDNAENLELNYCYNCMTQLGSGQTVCPACGHDNSADHNPPDTLPEGSILAGKYLVGKVLGQGGFGITYLGINIALKVRAAIKEYFPKDSCTRMPGTFRVLQKSDSYQQGCNEFQAEAQRLAQTDSPNIVKVSDYFLENGTGYIVMNYLEGNSLTKEIEICGGRMPWRRVSELFRPLISELDKLHRDHLIHRDIKPDNLKIIKDKDGKERLVLLDFGAARSFVSEKMTGNYTAVLTPGYAPLEQYSVKARQGPYTDIYALCATMYAAITGTPPATANDRILGLADVDAFSELGINVPKNIEAAILHGLAVRSENRPQTMLELYDEMYGGSVPEAPEQALYAVAKRLMAVGNQTGYDQALQLFEQISGYKDADSLAEICRRKIIPMELTPPAQPKRPWIVILAAVLAAAAGIFLYMKFSNRGASEPTGTAMVSTPAQAADTLPANTAEPTQTPLPTATTEPTQTPLSTNTPEPTALPLSSLRVGDTFTLGHYEQDGSSDNGAEAIEWLVLAVENGNALVISKYGLDVKPYNEKPVSVTWETSSLRKWLNEDFYNSAFSDSERGRIQQVTIGNPKNPSYGTEGGKDTTDRIFLLSIDEAAQYFSEKIFLMCPPTTYAKNNGAVSVINKDGETALWWLRSPGISEDYAAIVYTNGLISKSGTKAVNKSGTVRPAFRMDLSETPYDPNIMMYGTDNGLQTYTLQEGESLVCLGRRFDISLSQLMAQNGLSDPDVVGVGSTVVLPKDPNPWNLLDGYGRRTLILHPASYTVGEGDTLFSIACLFGDVHPEDIAIQNKLVLGEPLPVGSTILIP